MEDALYRVLLVVFVPVAAVALVALCAMDRLDLMPPWQRPADAQRQQRLLARTIVVALALCALILLVALCGFASMG